MRRFAPFAIAFLLLACESSGVSVYDRNDSRVGSVIVGSTSSARIYDTNDTRVGSVDGHLFYDASSSRIGSVNGTNDILDRNGTRVGKLREGKKCFDRNETRVGRIAQDINSDAAAGACLVLLLR